MMEQQVSKVQKKKSTKESDEMNDFFSPEAPRSVKDLSDMELAYYLSLYAGAHAFLEMCSQMNYQDPAFANKCVANYSSAQILMEARARVTSKRAVTDNYVMAKMKGAKDVAISNTQIIVTKEDSGVETLTLERGAYDIIPIKVREATVMANIIVLTQKPVIVTKNGEKSVQPVQTDTTGSIFPSYKALPPKLLQIYKTGKDVPGIVEGLTTVLQDYKDKVQYVQLNAVVPHLSYASTGSIAVKDFTRVHTKSTPERDVEYMRLEARGVRMAKDDDKNFLIKGFARPPTHKKDDTLISAYRYLQESRAIRGEKGGGITSLTAMYYHGDIVLSMWRTYSLVFNILAIRANCLAQTKNFPPIPDGVILEAVESKGLSQHAMDMIRLSVPTMSNYKFDYSGRKEYGLQKLGTGPFLVFHVVNRSFSLNKNGALLFTPGYQVIRDHIRNTVSSYATNMPKAQVHHFFHVLVCPDILQRAVLLPSAHPHPGFGWVYAKAEKGGSVLGVMAKGCSQAVYLERERIFAHRLILSNAYKNYYQFHRVPFVLVDQAFPIAPYVFLMRRTKASVTRTLLSLGEDDEDLQGGDDIRSQALEKIFHDYVILQNDRSGEAFFNKKKLRDPTPQDEMNNFFDEPNEGNQPNLEEEEEDPEQEGELPPNLSALDGDAELFG